MKAVFLGLVLANAVFLLWQFHAGRLDFAASRPQAPSSILLAPEEMRAQRGARIAAVTAQTLAVWRQAELDGMLADLRESVWHVKPGLQWPRTVKRQKNVMPAKVEQSVKTLPAPAVAAVVRSCYEAGPFADAKAVHKWLAKQRLADGRAVEKEVPVATDFQVYYPAAKTEEQSRANRAMLAEKGVADIWRIPAGDNKDGFSLGVFSDKERALIFKSQMAEKGIIAQIMQRHKTQSRWFARISLDKAGLKSLQAGGENVSTCSER